MNNLYALIINGTTYYLKGEIPEKMYDKIESIVNSISIQTSDTDHSKYLKQLTNEAKSKLNLNLAPIRVKYVFRKRP